jgi:hypothetical protein
VVFSTKSPDLRVEREGLVGIVRKSINLVVKGMEV